jgi:hypothetical protein
MVKYIRFTVCITVLIEYVLVAGISISLLSDLKSRMNTDFIPDT